MNPAPADVTLVRQSLLDEHHGNIRNAFEDACARLALAYHGVSWAMLRRMHPATEGKIDDVPNPIDDDWIRTALGDA